MREASLREHLVDRSSEAGLTLLRDIITLCLIGQPPGEDSMLALIACLRDLPETSEGFDAIGRLYSASQEGSVERFLLLEPPPHRRVPPNKKMGGPRWERDVTLGEKKTFAGGSNRIYLERLVYEAEPMVVEKLCKNPHIREEDIMTVVTRRPTYPEVLDAVSSSRWLARYRVRHGLVLNPYARTSLVLRLLPLLYEQHLTALQFVGDVHDLVHTSVKALVARRAAYMSGALD